MSNRAIDLNIAYLNTYMAGYITTALYWSHKDGETVEWDQELLGITDNDHSGHRAGTQGVVMPCGYIIQGILAPNTCKSSMLSPICHAESVCGSIQFS